MSLLLVILVTAASVLAGTGLCFYLLYKANEVGSTLWILEHILCPIMRIIVLLIVVSQVFPAVDDNLTSLDFWRILTRQNHFRDMVNILFFAGLLLAFVPLVNHPAIALPLQGMFTIALVFHWQYIDSTASLTLFPSTATLIKITAYMLLAWYVTRELSTRLSRWTDKRFVISGSIRLISDAVFMVLQIPVMLIYCGFLEAQLS